MSDFESMVKAEHYPPGTPATIDIETVTVPENLSASAARYGDRAALVFLEQAVSYRELDALVNRCVRAFRAIGIGEGTRVAIMLPNVPQFVVANYAVLRMGAVAVMVNPLYTERELEYILDDADVHTVVVLDQLFGRVAAVWDNVALEQCVVVHVNDLLGVPAAALPEGMHVSIEPREGVHELATIMADRDDAALESLARWEALAVLIYTGGTTGRSKGVMLSHANISASVQQTIASTQTTQRPGEESTLAVYPFFHVAGFTVVQNGCIRNGCTMVLVPRPTPEALVALIDRHRPTLVQAVPTLFVGMLATEPFRRMDLTSIRQLATGAAPMSGDTFDALRQLCPGIPVTEGYGLTECAGLACSTPSIDRVKPGSVGLPMPNTSLRIVDVETGRKSLPIGETGEVVISGPQVMEGYLGKPQETAETLRDGWLFTGDVGYLDEEGWLFIKDRKKDLILASGYNVYPKEVDDVLFEHPAIREACVVGVPDDYRGETVKAFVVLNEGESLDETAVQAFCRERLAAYKVPTTVAFLDELPKSPVGKILRRALRDA